MTTHNWTGIEWGEEFGLLPENINVQGEGSLAPGDEVIVRLRVAEVETYFDEPDQFRARLVPAEVKPVISWGQRIRNLFGRAA